jgi:TRAP-type C4-dicarboxylate transport system substrate-binding protein
MSKQKIKWLITHEPQELFIRAAHCFEQKLDAKLPGKFELELYTSVKDLVEKNPNDFTAEEKEVLLVKSPALLGLEFDSSEQLKAKRETNFNYRAKKWKKVFEILNDGRIHMSQAQVNVIGGHLDRSISVLDLPFLFKDHDHVTRTVEGAVGKIISHRVHEKTGVKPLCYTYSGGYRVIGATNDIKSLEDLKNQPRFIATTGSSGFLFKSIGATNTITNHTATDRDVQDMNENGGSIETTLIRFTGKHVLKTNHSMFMTSILCGESFWNSLTPAERELFVEAGLETSRQERVWSLEDAAKIEAEAAERGLTINSITDEETAELKETSKKCYQSGWLKSYGIDEKLVQLTLKS